MAEAIGLTASIIAVVQLAKAVTSVCKSFIDGVADYPKDLRFIYIEISSLIVVLEGVESTVRPQDAADAACLSILLNPEGPVQGCMDALGRLEGLVSPGMAHQRTQNGPKTKKQRVQASLASLAWPLKAGTAKGILDEIIQHKATISLALEGESLKAIKQLQKSVDQISTSLSDDQKRQICQWFCQTDPSFSYQAAIELYEPGTGDWVLRCKEWQQWTKLKLRCIWIRGIPGAGKTILASHLIQELKSHCAQQPNNNKVLTIYYYCFHGHNQDETKPLLRWIICELCRRTDIIPQKAYSMYEQGHAPTLIELMACLSSLLELSDLEGVFLVIDALDESQDRHNLLKTVRDLVSDSRFNKIHMLTTSREYLDIEETMSPISEPLSMSDNESVQADIRHYVTAKISSHPKFQGWSSTLRAEVEVALSAGAKGMFRWVVCQLDILCRLINPDRIRNAISSLPATLDETYERIFSLVVEEEKSLVRYALHWLILNDLIWTKENISLFEGDASLFADDLASVCSILDFSEGPIYGPFNVESLREACGCLVRFVPLPGSDTDENYSQFRVTIAHYTVREYLESARSEKQFSSFFKIAPGHTLLNVLLDMFRATLSPQQAALVQGIQDLNMPDMQLRCSYTLLAAVSQPKVFNSLLGKGPTLTSLALLLDVFDPAKSDSMFSISGLLKENTVCDDSDVQAFVLCNITSSASSPDLQFENKISPPFFDTPFWLLEWPNLPNQSDIAVIRQILSLLTVIDTWSLTEPLIQDNKHLLSTQITIGTPVVFCKYPWYINTAGIAQKVGEFATRPITGTMAEIMAQLGNETAVNNFCKWFPSYLDLRSVLLHLFSTHIDYYPGCNVGIDCPLNTLLGRGAHLDPHRSYATPLQVAVATGYEDNIKMLLQARADPNELGDANSSPWNSDSALFRCNQLHHHSPLNIARNKRLYLLEDHPLYRGPWEDHSAVVEALLLEYGANDFVRDEIGNVSQAAEG
ncbi:hypothetical protein QBC38DRAFT_456116 [Podospora fimiseda]|uniref:NACHT domain-containing protein n=1 Tax=Podospora fimiseda TaxID=252190 RepID=A0AAN7GTE1_9PEZI|nr:hypothetical protein QBC38DRAFT_456116 [Podospora fimiseda]